MAGSLFFSFLWPGFREGGHTFLCCNAPRETVTAWRGPGHKFVFRNKTGVRGPGEKNQ